MTTEGTRVVYDDGTIIVSIRGNLDDVTGGVPWDTVVSIAKQHRAQSLRREREREEVLRELRAYEDWRETYETGRLRLIDFSHLRARERVVPYHGWCDSRLRGRGVLRQQLAAPRRPVHARRERLPVRSRPGRRRRRTSSA